MRGNSRGPQTNLSNYLLSIDYEKYPGIGSEFLEIKKWNMEEGSWYEYKLLLRAHKLKEDGEYIGYLLKNLGKLISSLYQTTSLNINTLGLEEFDGSDPDSYYFLIYILADGKENPNQESLIEEEN